MTRSTRLLAALAVAILLAACQGAAATPTPSITQPPSTATSAASPSIAPSASAATSSATPSGQAAWSLVAIGDSSTTGSGDPTGVGWVGAYADAIKGGTGHEVVVTNAARNGSSSADWVAAVKSDPGLRSQLEQADIVAIGLGGSELNAGDDAFASGSCKDVACYDAPLETWTTNLEAIVAEVARIRAGKPTAIRAITMMNGLTGAEDVIPPFLASVATKVGVYQAHGFNKATCAILEAHDGACADLLTAFNGPDGTGDAYATGLMNKEDCCYPSTKGQALIGQLLYQTGLAPLSGG